MARKPQFKYEDDLKALFDRYVAGEDVTYKALSGLREWYNRMQRLMWNTADKLPGGKRSGASFSRVVAAVDAAHGPLDRERFFADGNDRTQYSEKGEGGRRRKSSLDTDLETLYALWKAGADVTAVGLGGVRKGVLTTIPIDSTEQDRRRELFSRLKKYIKEYGAESTWRAIVDELKRRHPDITDDSRFFVRSDVTYVTNETRVVRKFAPVTHDRCLYGAHPRLRTKLDVRVDNVMHFWSTMSDEVDYVAGHAHEVAYAHLFLGQTEAALRARIVDCPIAADEKLLADLVVWKNKLPFVIEISPDAEREPVRHAAAAWRMKLAENLAVPRLLLAESVVDDRVAVRRQLQPFLRWWYGEHYELVRKSWRDVIATEFSPT